MDRIGGVMVSVHASRVVDRMDRITIGGVMVRRARLTCVRSYGPHHHRWCNVSMHASNAVDRMDRITIGGVMVSVYASSVVDRMDRITIGGVMVSVHQTYGQLLSNVIDYITITLQFS